MPDTAPYEAWRTKKQDMGIYDISNFMDNDARTTAPTSSNQKCRALMEQGRNNIRKANPVGGIGLDEPACTSTSVDFAAAPVASRLSKAHAHPRNHKDVDTTRQHHLGCGRRCAVDGVILLEQIPPSHRGSTRRAWSSGSQHGERNSQSTLSPHAWIAASTNPPTPHACTDGWPDHDGPRFSRSSHPPRAAAGVSEPMTVHSLCLPSSLAWWVLGVSVSGCLSSSLAWCDCSSPRTAAHAVVWRGAVLAVCLLKVALL